MEVKTLALYLGCECQIQPFDKVHKGKLLGVAESADHRVPIKLTILVQGDHGETTYLYDRCKFKLHLRPLLSMNENEVFNILQNNHLYPITNSSIEGRWVNYRLQYEKRISKVFNDYFPVHPKNANAVKYMLSQGLDIFGLIEKGEAIDATK